MILLGIAVGAGLYEMRVVVPLWAHSPPESAWYWEAQRTTNPQYTPNSGLRLWVFLTPTHTLLSLATLIAGLKTRGAHRRWLMASTITAFLLHLSAFVWFVPVITEILNSRSLGISPDQVVSKTHMWVTLSWLRFVIGLAAFFAGLRALTIPPLQDLDSQHSSRHKL